MLLRRPWVLRVVFPACAGVILVAVVVVLEICCVPRMCGGDPGAQDTLNASLKCSPHVRG